MNKAATNLSLGLVILCCAVIQLSAKDVQTSQGATLAITTKTAFGWDIDRPYAFGLQESLPQFGLYYNMSPYQKITNRIKTDDPIGYIELELYPMSINFSNGANPDDNTPRVNQVQPGWNNPDLSAHPSGTGYFAPFYMGNLNAGILWGNWFLQLYAGGDEYSDNEFDKPWNKSLQYSNERVMSDWAYMDTRVQYRRPTITQMLVSGTSDSAYWVTPSAPQSSYYWSYQNNAAAPNQVPLDEMNLVATGPLVGMRYDGENLSVMGKFETESDWTNPNLSATNLNGTAFGLDYAITPTSIKGFRVLGSYAGEFNYGEDKDPDPMVWGNHFGYDIALGKGGLSLEPYLGYDLGIILNSGASPTIGHEFAGGLTLHWPGTSGWAYDYLAERSGVTLSGATLAYKLYNANPQVNPKWEQSLLFTLFEDSGDEGILYGVGSEIVAEWTNFASSTSALEVSAYLDYTFKTRGDGTVVPWTRVFWDNLAGSGAGRVSSLKTDVGLKFVQFIRNTTIALQWESRDLNAAGSGLQFGVLQTYVTVSL